MISSTTDADAPAMSMGTITDMLGRAEGIDKAKNSLENDSPFAKKVPLSP